MISGPLSDFSGEIAEFNEDAAGIRFDKSTRKAATVDENGKLLPGISGWAKDFTEGAADKTVMNYLSFSSVVKITTQNLTAMMAFSPVATWAFQELGVALGLISAVRPEPRLLAAMGTFIAAVLLIFWAGRRAHHR